MAGLVHCLLLSCLKNTICTNLHGGCGECCIKLLCWEQDVVVCLQLHDLVRTFPRFSFETASDAGTNASQPDTPKRPPQPSTPAAHTASSQAPQSAAAAAAAAAMASTARAAASAGNQQEQQEHALQQLIASIAAAAAAAAAKAPAATTASPASAGGSASSTPRVPPLGEPSAAAASAAAGAAGAASRGSPRLQGQPIQQQPWVNPLYGVSRKPSPEREPREAREGRQGAISPVRSSSRQQQVPTSPGSVTGARAVPPPQKMLTPDESAKLMGLYK